MSKPKKITFQSFKPFGTVIDYPGKETKGKTRNLWRIVHNEPGKCGWRIAYLILRDKSLGIMGCHPTSDESFEPIKGKSLLFVSNTKNLNDIQCFVLDRPVIVYKGIWHGIISVTKESEIKITENHKVTSRRWRFGFRIKTISDLQKRINT